MGRGDFASKDDIENQQTNTAIRFNMRGSRLSETDVDDSSSIASITHAEQYPEPPRQQQATDGTASHPEGRLRSLISRFMQKNKTDKKPSILPMHKLSAAHSASNETLAYREKPEQDSTFHYSSQTQRESRMPAPYVDEARNLVRTLTERHLNPDIEEAGTGTHTPTVDRMIPDLDYVPAPEHYKPSIFAAILASKLGSLHESPARRNQRHSSRYELNDANIFERQSPKHDHSHSHDSSAPTSGTTTPLKKVKWYDKPEQNSMAGLLVQAAMSSTSTGLPSSASAIPPAKLPRSKSADRFSSGIERVKNTAHRHKKSNSTDSNDELVMEVAEIIARRNYLTKLCGAFMKCGAPTHRMEAYLAASARALSIEADFLYIPGVMICTFIDHSILSNNVEVVRKTGGLDFGRLKDVFNIYKNVIHKKFTAQEGIQEIDNVLKRPDRHSELFRILMFGLASVTVGPFSFSCRPIDLGPIFVLGCMLGVMQIKFVPKSEQFSNVFEVFACVIIAFVSRALGSIKYASGDYIFCFSGIAQSSIAMILPGFLVLNSALELQGKNMVSGSVRMIYAIIYVLFLGFGLLIGTTIFGLIKHDAVQSTTCNVPDWFYADGASYKLLYTNFIWVPLFACCLALIYQAKWRQLPVMAFIAVSGHQASYWISTQLSNNPQIAPAIGAFVIGCLANLYSRFFHGLAASAMLPAIYCQVPGGLAAAGSLVSGIIQSNQIVSNSTVTAQDQSADTGSIYNVGYGMVQVSIGISVGLYLSALVVYPFGKRRSGLFSF